MKFYFKVLSQPKAAAGFTLIELLIAAALTSAVAAVGFFGIITIMDADNRAEAETQRRMELNRALDFMAEEVKMANKVELDAQTATVTGFTAATGTTNVQKVLVLNIPTGVKVVYYIASPPGNSVWSGNRVIYRWGPTFNADGNYTTAANQNRLLVDFIDDSTPNPNSNCSTNWSANPAKNNRKGFYACVEPTGRVVEVVLLGTLNDPSEHLEVKTRVFARSAP